MEIKTITTTQWQQLSAIIPSHDWEMEYYPCRAILNNGTTLDNVYIVDAAKYLKHWGVLPTEDKAKHFIEIEEVVNIENSPNRMPANYADKLYEAGESGMGYCVFKIIYNNGAALDVLTGNGVDFVPSPEGLTVNDIVDVMPHQGSRSSYSKGLSYFWCLFKV